VVAAKLEAHGREQFVLVIRFAARSAMLLSTTAAGTISHKALGFCNLLTRSASELAPTAFSETSSFTAFSERSYTTQSWPPLISRRTMFPPIRPNPIIPRSMVYSFLNPSDVFSDVFFTAGVWFTAWRMLPRTGSERGMAFSKMSTRSR